MCLGNGAKRNPLLVLGLINVEKSRQEWRNGKGVKESSTQNLFFLPSLL